MAAPQTGEEYHRRTERIKNLLSSYYHLDDDAQSTGTSNDGQSETDSVTPTLARTSLQYTSNVSAIDSPGFNPDKHFSQVLKSFPLEKLMTEHRSMTREIKNLDSDMQQLVYENYNKFIAATDTIRTMKSNVDNMKPDLDKLKTIIDAVSEKSGTVNLKLQRRRQDIEELNKVQALLRKLQVVFDLPKRMRAALAEDALDTAVTYYAEASPLLRKYGGRGAFRVVAAEVDAVAREVSAVLRRRLLDRKADAEQALLLLRRLGEPDETLQDKYIQGRLQRLRKILKEGGLAVDAMAAAASGAPAAAPKVDEPESWGFGAEHAPPPLKSFLKSLDEKAINMLQDTAANVTSFFLQLPEGADRASRDAKRKPLLAMAREVFTEYFRVVKRALADWAAAAVHRAARVKEAAEEQGFNPEGSALKFTGDWGADMLAQCLSQVSADLGLLHPQLPELSLRDRCAELVEGGVRHHLQLAFGTLEQRVTGAVARAQAVLATTGPGSGSDGAGGGRFLTQAFSFGAEVLSKGLAALLQGLKGYDHQQRLLAPWHDVYVDLVQGHLQHLFLSLIANFTEVTKVKYDGADLLREALRTSAAGSAQHFSSTSESLTLASAEAGKVGATTEAAAPAGARLGAPEPPKTGLVLLLVKLCVHMESHVVPFVMEAIANSFAGKGGSSRGGDQPPAFVAGEVARKLTSATQGLLAVYVELHGRQLSVIVRRSVASTNWLQANEPRAPRPVCDLILERLSRAEAEVVQLASNQRGGDKGGHKRNNSGEPSSATAAEAGGNVERGVARLFRDKPKIFGGSISFSASAIMAAIVAVGLKSLQECIRLQTLGRAGLHQLQLDVHYLRLRLRRMQGLANGTVESLLDDVVTAGSERSTEGAALADAAMLDRILSSADGEYA